MKNKIGKIRHNKNKRLGRGYGSGKGGHTSSRGQKGQKARRNIGILFEGMKMKKSLIKRLPFRRGKGKFNSNKKPMTVNIEALNLMKAGSRVNIETLSAAGIVDKSDAMQYGVKILGNGEIKVRVIIELPISKSAAKKIEKAGGEIVGK